VDENVSFCGYTAESSFGAWSYFVERPQGGNVLVDSPRAAGPLLKELERRGGVATMFLTHRDDVAEGRIDVVGRIPIDAYFSSYRDVDIALDSFPYNGATTTCDALLMGVPVATVAGDRAITCGGLSLLSALGLSDWVAGSAGELAEMLQKKTTELERVAALRAALPARMRASPLMDGPRFARNVETVFFDAWQRRSA